MQIILLIVSLIFLWQPTEAAMTEKQMKAAAKLAKNTCQPKSKATEEMIEGMHKGIWNYEKEAMCYMYCAFNLYKLLTTDNKLNYEVTMANVKNLPASKREITKAGVDKCRDIDVPTDKCGAAYAYSRCLYENSPEDYFLP